MNYNRLKDKINKTELIQLRVTKEQKECLKRLSKYRGLKTSELLLLGILKVISEDEEALMYLDIFRDNKY